MSPNPTSPPESPIARRVLKVESLTHESHDDRHVIAVETELCVRRSALATPRFHAALKEVADRVGTLADLLGPSTTVVRPGDPSAEGPPAEPPDYVPRRDGPLSQVEVWRLRVGASGDSIHHSRLLRELADDETVRTPDGDESVLPAISPKHAAILSPAAGGCPATPPAPAGNPGKPFIEPPTDGPTARVTILDSGYIWTDPPHRHLDERVTVVRGQWLDPVTNTWQPDGTDGLYTNPAGQLDGISGHGTFIAGLVSHIAPGTRLEAVGLRNQEVEIGVLDPDEQLGLFETEVAIAHAMLRRSRTDVIQCGFAFPTLDDYPSLPFWAVMQELRMEYAPHGGRVAVVAPAGNERSCRPHWPAALPSVVGVAATDPSGRERADFSNWGEWCDCCTRGADVYSTFVSWHGSVEGEPRDRERRFDGWATWNGTSFAAPQVSAEIARLFLEGNRSAPPADVADQLIESVKRSSVTDDAVCGSPVSLPYLQIG